MNLRHRFASTVLVNLDKQIIIGYNTDIKRPYYGFPVSYNGHLFAIDMKIFNTVGETVITRGRVRRKWLEGGEALAELEIWSENSKGISVGPGTIIVALPRREAEGGEKRT
jgi:hypothetical protein